MPLDNYAFTLSDALLIEAALLFGLMKMVWTIKVSQCYPGIHLLVFVGKCISPKYYNVLRLSTLKTNWLLLFVLLPPPPPPPLILSILKIFYITRVVWMIPLVEWWSCFRRLSTSIYRPYWTALRCPRWLMLYYRYCLCSCSFILRKFYLLVNS